MLSGLSNLSLRIIFCLFSSDADGTLFSEGSSPPFTHITTSRLSSQLLSQVKKELAQKGLEGELKSSNSVDLQSLVDILAEGGMIINLRSSLLLYYHRSS